MLEFIRNFLPEGVRAAAAKKIVAMIATGAAALVAKWLYALLAHYGLPVSTDVVDYVKEISGGVFSIISGGGALAYMIWDAKTVHAKVITAAATGSVAAADDPQLRADVTQAVKTDAAMQAAIQAAPKTKDEALARLRAGTA